MSPLRNASLIKARIFVNPFPLFAEELALRRTFQLPFPCGELAGRDPLKALALCFSNRMPAFPACSSNSAIKSFSSASLSPLAFFSPFSAKSRASAKRLTASPNKGPAWPRRSDASKSLSASFIRDIALNINSRILFIETPALSKYPKETICRLIRPAFALSSLPASLLSDHSNFFFVSE